MQIGIKHIIKLLFIAIIVLNSNILLFGQQKKFKVVIDAGHGGKDPGARGTGKMKKREKDVALAVALAVEKELKKHNEIKIILTRKKDIFLELHERARIANKAKADLFLSIHCNANSKSRIKGSESYVLGIHRNKDNLEVAKRENSVIKLEKDNKLHYEGFNPNHPESFIGLSLLQETFLDQSIRFASTIQKHYRKNLNSKIPDRSVQQAGFAVLRLTYMPSVLTEIGFLTNAGEEKYLHSKLGQEKIAKSIANAIIEYYRYIKANSQVEIVDKQKKESEKQIKQKIIKGVIFKVQLLASKQKIDLKSKNFNGLKNLSIKRVGLWYKYFTGNTSDYNKIKKLKELSKQKGYNSAFVVAYKNGKRVDLKEILK